MRVKRLTLIYRENYWDRVKGDDLPNGIDFCVFDWAVNSGTGRAAKKLQAMIGTTVDGGIGPNTLRALKMYCNTEGIEAAISDYTKMRQEFYEGLSTFDTFGRGWTRRNEETEIEAYKMAGIYLPS